ncbi:MAG: transporter substrate-binding domain-containing protein [Muribaculaceae bacterium]|nr:transporter substrate-binding domain-containing protein [Muribaculaceae bacterium]
MPNILKKMLKKISKIKKWQLALYAVLLFVVIGLMFSLRNCGNEQPTMVTVNNRVDCASGGDTIDVAIEYSPLSYYTYSDTTGGFYYELINLISHTSGLKVKFHPIVSLNTALEGLDKGVYDFVAAQFPVTMQNKENYLFTEALYLDKQVLVQRNTGGIAIKSQLDLAGDTVTIVKGSPMRERIMSLSREIGDTIYVISDPEYGPEQLFMMVASGDIKYAVINETIARKMIASHPNVDISQAISFSQFQSFFMKKDNSDLCGKLNEAIQKVKKLPEYNELIKKYFY